MGDDYRLVYSSDGSHKNICKNCEKAPCACKKSSSIRPEDLELKIRLEKKGRGGKAVSVIFNFPHNPDYFKKLSKKIKSHCGTGGSFKNDTIEIQGDQRDKIKSFLEKEGFKVKLAGG